MPIHPASYGVYALFGGALFSDKGDILSMLLALFPMLLLCFTATDYMLSDYASCCVYIFTRSNNRTRWFIKKTVGLLCWILLFYVVSLCLQFLVIISFGISVDFDAAFSISVWTFLLNTLAVFMLLLPMNLLAIRFGAVVAYISGIAAYLILLSAATVFKAAARWLPVSQGMYAWHDTPWAEQHNFLQSIHLQGFTVSYSVIYMLIAVAVEVGIGIIIIERMDLLSLPEGEN